MTGSESYERAKLDLVRAPYWVRQPDESEYDYAKFIEFCTLDGTMSISAFCRDKEYPRERCYVNKWRERSELFWTDVSDELAIEAKRRVAALRERALDVAIASLGKQTRVEKSEERKHNGEVNVTTREIEVLPNAHIVGIVLQNLLDSMAGQSDATAEQLAALFRQALQNSETKGITE